ncbi:methyltransferase type 12 [Tribonema minus]|uniref:Methyltransferase type 12 n=1 Tax=Tribonema minus TaxID=303371 RepID=A0A835Z8T5_9STRA|nr:methyltransferase type 12 [Tribonema minus]
MEQAEEQLAERAQASASPMIANLIKSLGQAIVYYPDAGNLDTNRKLWDAYASEWSQDASWVQDMARGSRPGDGGPSATAAGAEPGSAGAASDREGGASAAAGIALERVGEEWSTSDELMQVVREFILPYLNPDSRAAELGCGGGRVAVQVYPHVSNLDCYDISPQMLTRCAAALKAAGARNATLQLLTAPALPAAAADSYDFLYCFDVLVHVDLHVSWRYLREVRRCLTERGRAFLSFASVCSRLGWERFARQSKFTVGGFYFMCPEMVRFIVAKAGLRIVREGPPEGTTDNVYYNRDFLIVVEKDSNWVNGDGDES